MGYTTTFRGQVNIEPPLNAADLTKLQAVANQDQRDKGPGQVPNAPSNYCQWEPVDGGSALRWDGNEKFYDSYEWMQYLVAGLAAKGYVCNGTIDAQGEQSDDKWRLSVVDNLVSRQEARIGFDEPPAPRKPAALTETKMLR